jgi:hypothetical protein
MLVRSTYQKVGQLAGVSSMLRRLTKQETTRKNRADEGGESLHQFLRLELPPGKAKQATYLADALIAAGKRYDRYDAYRTEWLGYAARRNRLTGIARLADALASELCKLDIVSRDDLACRNDPRKLEALVGSLRLLHSETVGVAKHIQENGRPRDLAEERWILELADIYENAFCRPASVWGSGDEETKRRGTFYHLLEVSRPASFPRYGKLNVRQVARTLRQRRNQKANGGLTPFGDGKAE